MMKKSGRRDDKLVLRQLRQSHHRRPLSAHLPREVKRLEPTESCYPECRGERDYLSEVSAEQLEGLRLFSLLREQPFQFCNANKVFLTHGRFIMRP
ncbi:transposase [Escherichia coli]|nr:transposase [Escherichia coli]